MIPELSVTEAETEMLIKAFRGPIGDEFAAFLRRVADLVSFDEDPGVMAFKEGRRQLALFLAMASEYGKGVVGEDYVDPNSIDSTEERVR